jgi:hypothetical protein
MKQTGIFYGVSPLPLPPNYRFWGPQPHFFSKKKRSKRLTVKMPSLMAFLGMEFTRDNYHP